ncbi:MAG TPA: DUF6770 family protein [Puia sp.]|nr:DUF6770 family protein [Puia sp.]
MTRRLLLPLSLILMTIAAHAQTKVFKEVGEDIATQMKVINQDNALVGYLAFTRLEKTDVDSFNYRLTIMDENLNDIGTVNFRERKLELMAVSFEQDVLCLGYVESAMAGILTGHESRQAYKHANLHDQLLFQFISLSGKIKKTFTSPVTLESTPVLMGGWGPKYASFLKQGIQIENVSGVGFAAFYGDHDQRELLLLDTAGRLIRRKKVTVDFPGYYLQTSGSDIYLLTKMHIDPAEGGYQLHSYTVTDSLKKETVLDLKDKQGNWFKVLSYDNDPTTGKTYIAGCVINDERSRDFITAHDLSRNPYLGLFSMTLGPTKADVKTTYSYWTNSSYPGIDQSGLFTGDNEFYARYGTAFRDFDGTTVFIASALDVKRLLAFEKYKFADAAFVTQDAKGKLKLTTRLPCDETSYFGPAGKLNDFDHKDFYKVVNQDTKTNFIIVDDMTNIYIYDFTKKKLVRTISHKDGHTITRVFPAKEGHVMVSEVDSKAKQTRFSIEAL